MVSIRLADQTASHKALVDISFLFGEIQVSAIVVYLRYTLGQDMGKGPMVCDEGLIVYLELSII